MKGIEVSEITVEAQNKVWATGVVIKGSSGGTILSWKVVPSKSRGLWTIEEAAEVTMLVRRNLHALLIMDSRARGVSEPEGEVGALKLYDNAIKAVEVSELKGDVSELGGST